MPARTTRKKNTWRIGRGRLGALAPLLGAWKATADSSMGRVECLRVFSLVLDGTAVQLDARWRIGRKKYEELAILRPGDDGTIEFFSFTSDGKSSRGTRADVSDVHPLALGFEAEMPAGRARVIYWPDDETGFHWAVESRSRKGWTRFTHHHYRPADRDGWS